MVTKHYRSKKSSGSASIAALFIISSAIVILGVVFSVYAVINNISFLVMGAKIPAVLFAAVVVFLGLRYFLATIKLWSRIKGQKFSWSNFKKQVKTGSPKSRQTFWGDNKNNVKGEA